jgi:hypothetical protein
MRYHTAKAANKCVNSNQFVFNNAVPRGIDTGLPMTTWSPINETNAVISGSQTGTILNFQAYKPSHIPTNNAWIPPNAYAHKYIPPLNNMKRDLKFGV